MKPRYMKSMLHPLAGLAIAAATVISAQAATVVFGPATTFSSATVLDTPYAAGYTFVSAMNIGDNAKTFNTPGGTSITFDAGNTVAILGNVDMPAAPSSTTGFYNGGSAWDWGLGPDLSNDFNNNLRDIMNGHAYHNVGSDATQPLTLHLTGLTVGETYAAYLYSVDARSNDRTQAYWDGFSSPNFTGNTSGSFSQNGDMVVQGTFTADATYQDIFIQATDSVGNPDTTISAYTLYNVPEPSSALLLTGAGLLIGFRRSRR